MDPRLRRTSNDRSAPPDWSQAELLPSGAQPLVSSTRSRSPLETVLDDPIDFEEYAQSRLQDFAKR